MAWRQSLAGASAPRSLFVRCVAALPLLGLWFASSVHAHIAFNCDTPIEHGRVDPIVYPGSSAAGHSHVIFGSSCVIAAESC